MHKQIGATSAEDVTHTGAFGKVPKGLIRMADIVALQQSGGRIAEAAVVANGADDQLVQEVNDFRAHVGGLWLHLWRQLDYDTETLYGVSTSFWKCVWISLFTRRLHPQKYYHLCGRPAHGYGLLVTQLANMPPGGTALRERVFKEWGVSSWKEYANRVWRTKNQLLEKEVEYRAAANVVLQVGIGWGGMVLGLIGLALSIAVPLFF